MASKIVHYAPSAERSIYEPTGEVIQVLISKPELHGQNGGRSVNGLIATPEAADVTCKACLRRMA